MSLTASNFGIVVGNAGTEDPDDMMAAVAATGVEWARFDLRWETEEPSDGTFVWSLKDVLQAAKDNGVSTYVTVQETPAWANSSGLKKRSTR